MNGFVAIRLEIKHDVFCSCLALEHLKNYDCANSITSLTIVINSITERKAGDLRIAFLIFRNARPEY